MFLTSQQRNYQRVPQTVERKEFHLLKKLHIQCPFVLLISSVFRLEPFLMWFKQPVIRNSLTQLYTWITYSSSKGICKYQQCFPKWSTVGLAKGSQHFKAMSSPAFGTFVIKSFLSHFLQCAFPEPQTICMNEIAVIDALKIAMELSAWAFFPSFPFLHMGPNCVWSRKLFLPRELGLSAF